MTKSEFEKIFIPLASVWCSPDHATAKIPAYFAVLKNYSVHLFKEIALQISDNSPSKFLLPGQIKDMCMESIAKRNSNTSNTDEYIALPDHVCYSDAALRARREFFMTLAKLHDEKSGGTEDDFSNVARAMGESALHLAKKWEKNFDRLKEGKPC